MWPGSSNKGKMMINVVALQHDTGFKYNYAMLKCVAGLQTVQHLHRQQRAVKQPEL
jgi:hypothetical protein